MNPLSFHISHRDADPNSRARVGTVETPHGSFRTPAFMPVGTQGSVKGMLPEQVRGIGAEIILGNTYHLLLRPGSELIARMGGLQKWTRWEGPMLTDSGGFQVFSLADTSRITDDGVWFRSHLDGAEVNLTPELSMRVQNELGADIIMAFDDCPPALLPGEFASAGGQDQDQENDDAHPGEAASAAGLEGEARGEERGANESSHHERRRHGVTHADYAARLDLANERTLRWLDRCFRAHARPCDQALFPIVQGGTDFDRRTWCAERVTQHDAAGYAIGGVAVGEGHDEIVSVVRHTAPLLPEDRPRYLMGVGYERDIVAAVRAGVDMFDCVLPTRNGRNGSAFTRTGRIRLKNARFRDDPDPIEPGCDCPACSIGGDDGSPGFSRSYLRHLFLAGEMLGPTLVSLHNLRHFQHLVLDIRAAITDNRWTAFARRWPVAADGLDAAIH